MAILFLLGAALLGAGLIRRVFGGQLSHAEQGLWGMVVGWTLVTLGAYIIARALGQLSKQPLIALTAALWIAAILFWVPTLRRITQRRLRIQDLWRSEYAGLALVLVIFSPIYWNLFSTHMLPAGIEGFYSGGSANYDLPFHMALTTSFLYGQNYPPMYTAFPPEPLFYPFLPDFLTAALICLGLSFWAALVITAVPLSLSITGIFYSLAARISHAPDLKSTAHALKPANIHPQIGASLASILFLLNGGVGFFYFFKDWRNSKRGIVEFWSNLDVNYANLPGERIHWTNLIVDTLLPQRTSLFGIPIALIILTLFVVVWQRWHGAPHEPWEGWRVLLPAGLLTALLLLIQPHSYIAVGLVSGFLFLLRPRRAWIVFWAPAVLFALPQLLNIGGHAAAKGFMRFQPGWRGHNEANWLFYWFRNIGIPLLLIVPAWLFAPRIWRKFYLAFVLLLIFSLLLMLSPNDYDNIKLMYYWYAMTCVLIALWLVRLATVHRQRMLAFVLTLLCIVSGLLALQHESLSHQLAFSYEEDAAARFVRDQTAPRALFLTASTIHQPILSLAGRPILRGDTAWLWSHGYEFQAREADVKSIYAGSPDALDLLRYYRISYVYLGRNEKELLKANQGFFDQALPIFYNSENIKIYDARSLLANEHSSDAAKLLSPYPPREAASRIGKDPYQFIIGFPDVGYAIYRYYKVAYARRPTYQEMLADLKFVGQNLLVSAPGWEEVLEQNKRALIDEWMNRSEFKTLYDGKTDAQYVHALYANAGVTPAPEAIPDRLATALRESSETRASVLRRIAENRELYRKEYNAAYVLLHYFGYLRRNPEDPPDNNLVGYNFWLGDLNKTGDYRSLGRVFIESGEYKDQKR